MRRWSLVLLPLTFSAALPAAVVSLDPVLDVDASAGGEARGSRQAIVTVVVETTVGRVTVEVDVARAPVTATNFLRYVDAGLYDGGVFHRAVRMDNQPGDEFRIEVIQAAMNRVRRDEGFDPIPMEGTGTTGLRHIDGTISMARGSRADSARAAFFICIGDQPELDEGGRRNPDGRGFAAFGRVVAGMEVVRLIQAGETDGQTLRAPVGILSARRGE